MRLALSNMTENVHRYRSFGRSWASKDKPLQNNRCHYCRELPRMSYNFKLTTLILHTILQPSDNIFELAFTPICCLLVIQRKILLSPSIMENLHTLASNSFSGFRSLPDEWLTLEMNRSHPYSHKHLGRILSWASIADDLNSRSILYCGNLHIVIVTWRPLALGCSPSAFFSLLRHFDQQRIPW